MTEEPTHRKCPDFVPVTSRHHPGRDLQKQGFGEHPFRSIYIERTIFTDSRKRKRWSRSGGFGAWLQLLFKQADIGQHHRILGGQPAGGMKHRQRLLQATRFP